MVAVAVVLLIIAVVLGVLLFSRKEAEVGKAVQQPIFEVPQEIVTKAYLPIETVETPAPAAPTPLPTAAQVQSPVPGEREYCKGSYSANTCYTANTYARKQCPRGYACKTVSTGWSAEGCYVELHCVPQKPVSGIKQ